ncbi:MAG: CRISPR-associated endonuclease Cas3'' [Verrucomicrobiae bacterium]|nr:CRISPR-associated endonuclease Cas3'' [Verrucomicrobiae bacterium]MCP5548293.1 CRISPR-associated endonuclease Cas3'' [Akkermansiaceae bacterium]
MKLFAHTHPDQPSDPSKWEPLFTPFGDSPNQCQGDACEKCRSLVPDHGHLNKVAYKCSMFAADMFPSGPARETARQWGHLAGLWHDLGKFAPEWQSYLASKADIHTSESTGSPSKREDHSTAGAQHASQAHLLGHLLAYPIAGHHSGLLDADSIGACQKARLTKNDLADWSNAPVEILTLPVPSLPCFLQRDGFSLGFFTRMLFSSLVDADFLATEAFMSPVKSFVRNQTPDDILQRMAELVRERIDSFGEPASDDIVNHQRRRVVDDCLEKSSDRFGFFTLTVPTGGGKTLSSLLFSLLHAIAHGQKRIIFVVPFTSIIEQNADVIRQILSPLATDTFTPLIEHHSALSPEKETERSRLAAENWDAPVIITTAVQFYESLFAANTSRSRKLHNIANSVVILDEAQTLPVDFLSPCLRVLKELSAHYHTTTVLCTATQPAIGHHPEEFPIGIENCREIISDTASLFTALKRVDLSFLGEVTDVDLSARLRKESQVLCIVNRRKHARELFRLLGKSEGNYHLSALMCPEHRSRILAEVRDRLEKKQPVRLVSTQLIEAGVDVDFPVVYRALAGLDSIAQAAGRCNRNGKLGSLGQTHVFIPEDRKGETYFRETAQIANQLIDLHPDLLGQEAIHHYFDLYYYQQKPRWDSKNIVADETFRLDGSDKTLPFKFKFTTVAKDFNLIDDWQVPVIVPYDDKARELVKQLRDAVIPLHRDLLRGLQRYTVQIPPKVRDKNIRSFESLRDEQFHTLISTELNYSDDFGITFDDEDTGGSTLVCGS